MIQSIFHVALRRNRNRQLGNGNKTRCIWIGEFANNNIGAASATAFEVILPTSSNLRAWSLASIIDGLGKKTMATITQSSRFRLSLPVAACADLFLP
jgi:hypothetical protein